MYQMYQLYQMAKWPLGARASGAGRRWVGYWAGVVCVSLTGKPTAAGSSRNAKLALQVGALRGSTATDGVPR